jgi:hypothetical protein
MGVRIAPPRSQGRRLFQREGQPRRYRLAGVAAPAAPRSSTGFPGPARRSRGPVSPSEFSCPKEQKRSPTRALPTGRKTFAGANAPGSLLEQKVDRPARKHPRAAPRLPKTPTLTHIHRLSAKPRVVPHPKRRGRTSRAGRPGVRSHSPRLSHVPARLPVNRRPRGARKRSGAPPLRPVPARPPGRAGLPTLTRPGLSAYKARPHKRIARARLIPDHARSRSFQGASRRSVGDRAVAKGSLKRVVQEWAARSEEAKPCPKYVGELRSVWPSWQE